MCAWPWSSTGLDGVRRAESSFLQSKSTVATRARGPGWTTVPGGAALGALVRGLHRPRPGVASRRRRWAPPDPRRGRSPPPRVGYCVGIRASRPLSAGRRWRRRRECDPSRTSRIWPSSAARQRSCSARRRRATRTLEAARSPAALPGQARASVWYDCGHVPQLEPRSSGMGSGSGPGGGDLHVVGICNGVPGESG